MTELKRSANIQTMAYHTVSVTDKQTEKSQSYVRFDSIYYLNEIVGYR